MVNVSPRTVAPSLTFVALGFTALLFIVFVNGVAAANPARDGWLWPFAAGSIWNMAIGSEARYVPAHIGAAANLGLDVEILAHVPAASPARAVYAPQSWGQRAGGIRRLGEVFIPDDLIVPDVQTGHTPNYCAALLMSDGRTVRNVGPLCRPEAGGPVYGYLFTDTDLYGDGAAGSHGGSGLSALGGSIRRGEFLGSDPIHHALKVSLWCKRYAYYGDDRKGFRWPATRADAYAADRYVGEHRELVMGSLLAVPPVVEERALALKTAVGRKLFAALRDYGAYVVDDAAWDCHYLCAEQGVAEEVERGYGLKFDGSSKDLVADVNALFARLAVVDNNAEGRVGGGGTPRVPLAPPLGGPPTGLLPAKGTSDGNRPGTESASTLPIVRNGSMTDGEDVPKHWSQTWAAAGKVAARRDATTFHSAPASLAVESVGGVARGQAMQTIDASPGTRFTVSGFVRAGGEATALVGIQSFTADWKGIEFKALGNATAGPDWRRFSGDVTLPAGTARFGIVLAVNGDGTVWLDDVEIIATAAPAGEGPGGLKVEPPTNAPNSTTAAEGFYPKFPHAWRQVVKAQVERAKKGQIDVVFLGDSLTQGWGEHPAWKERYEPLKAANFGVGGDGTPQVLWRIKEGILDGYEAKLVVLMIGINNTWPGYSAEDTATGIERVVAFVRERQPSAKVLLLGVLPVFDKVDSIRDRIRMINAAASKLDDGKTVRFLDMGGRFLEPDGSRRAELYKPDRLHLSDKGYETWAAAMEPIFREMLAGRDGK